MTSHLPIRFGGLLDSAIVYIAGFVVCKVLKSLTCFDCRGCVVSSATQSLEQSYHLLSRKNEGLIIPSYETVKVS